MNSSFEFVEGVLVFDVPLLEETRVLELAALGLLFDHDTVLSLTIHNGSELLIDWLGIEDDQIDFNVIFSLIDQSQDLNDAEFQKQVFCHVIKFAGNTRIFKLLEDPNVVLTADHQQSGMLSKEHILSGLFQLRTDGLPPAQRKLMRMFVLLHDLGKSLSAGMLGEKAMEILGLFGEDKNSFPQHQVTSALIAWSIIKGLIDSGTETFLSIGEMKDLFYLISRHHIFFDIKRGEKTFENLRGETETEKIKYFLFFYLFNFADVSAIPSNRKYRPGNRAYFEEVAAQKRIEPTEIDWLLGAIKAALKNTAV